MKKVTKYIPEILIVTGAGIIIGLVISINTMAGLFSLGLILVIVGFLCAKARE